MIKNKTILFFFGTRPEIIKLAPVIQEFKKKSPYIVKTCHTGQHAELTLEFERLFNIDVDYRMVIRNSRGDINTNIAEIITQTNSILSEVKPDLIFVQGDTTTVMTVALAAFNLGIKIGHIEAGLRSFNIKEPFPEELNRKIATLCAEFHFAPTFNSLENLKKEGVPSNKIWNTGNTVVDALMEINKLYNTEIKYEKKILVTVHRRENHGKPLLEICETLLSLSSEYSDYEFIWPVHPNPNISNIVKQKLAEIPNIKIIAPLPYEQLIKIMARCSLIWTDSGGIQEEAPYFKKPVLILRNVTERPEVIEAGYGIITGTNKNKIEEETRKILKDPLYLASLCSLRNPFGNGTASKQILEIICKNV